MAVLNQWRASSVSMTSSWAWLVLVMLGVWLHPWTLTVAVVGGRIIDVSHPHSEATEMSPGNPKYIQTSLLNGTIKPGVFVHFNKYSVGEHGGTHLDAPAHFTPGGRTLDQVPIEDTVLDAVMVDCSKETAKDYMYAVTVKKLTDWEKVNGRIPQGGAVVFNFNWSSKFADLHEYYSTNNLTNELSYKFPHISAEAAKWMVEKRNIKAVATDTASPDVMDSQYPVHKQFLTNKRLVVENLKDPGHLPARNFMFHFSPVKFVGGSGLQVRAYGVTYEPSPNHAPGFGGVRGGSWWWQCPHALMRVSLSLVAVSSMLLNTISL